MHFSKTTVQRRTLSRVYPITKILCAAIIGATAVTAGTPASAMGFGAAASLASQVTTRQSNPDILEVRAVARRGGVAVGPRGNAVAYRSRTVVRGPGVRPGYPGRWARPGWYRWPAGGAIAAGAALGFVAAAGAVAYAGSPPAPGMCWYYTDMTRTQGFWDYCP